MACAMRVSCGATPWNLQSALGSAPSLVGAHGVRPVSCWFITSNIANS